MHALRAYFWWWGTSIFCCFVVRRPEGEGANLDRRLVPYHGKCMRIQSHIEFIIKTGRVVKCTSGMLPRSCDFWYHVINIFQTRDGARQVFVRRRVCKQYYKLCLTYKGAFIIIINIWVNFQLFIILWQLSNFIKWFSDLICLICP